MPIPSHTTSRLLHELAPFRAWALDNVTEAEASGRKSTAPRPQLDRLVQAAIAIEEDPPKEAGALGFAARILVLATMPHSKSDEISFERSNGKYRLTMVAHPTIGLPYGSMARIILAYISTEAVRTGSPVIELGESMASFLRKLGTIPSGGAKGSITYFKEQAQRLFTTSVSYTYNDESRWAYRGYHITRDAEMWWDPHNPSDTFNSRVVLSREFYEELIRHPVPIDMRALNALRRSPLAMDIYSWLTYRFYRLSKPMVIPWASLELQFGSDYSDPRNFRRSFLKQLKKVKTVYPQAQVQPVPRKGLKLLPSPTHVAKLR